MHRNAAAAADDDDDDDQISSLNLMSSWHKLLINN